MEIEEEEFQVCAGPADAGPRGAARGGVSGPALPVQRGREGPLQDRGEMMALS